MTAEKLNSFKATTKRERKQINSYQKQAALQ